MKDIEQILQDSGIIIQPYWRKLYSHSTQEGEELRHAPDLRDRLRQDLARPDA